MKNYVFFAAVASELHQSEEKTFKQGQKIEISIKEEKARIKNIRKFFL